MATAAHINQFLSTHKTGLPFETVLRWCHRHPTLNKIIAVAAFILGAALIAATPFIGAWGIATALTGSVLALASTIALIAFRSIAPSHHDMKTHTFKPARCEGGELYYHGDIPILSIDGTNPFIAGKAQGYLLAEAIQAIKDRFDFALHTVARQPRAPEIPELIAQIKATIPEEYMTEIEGVVAGYNQWASEQSRWSRPKPMTIDEAVLFHLMPDANNLPIKGIVQNPFLHEATVACSSLVGRDRQKGIVFGRNMDWPSLDLTGKYTFVKHMKKGERQTVEVSIPGLVGTLTGMNHHGLCAAMNVCPRVQKPTVQGMPAVFYNRRLLETCRDVPAATQFRNQNHPLGPYHLTVADPQTAASFHFYQATPTRKGTPLATFNIRIGEKNPVNQHYSIERSRMLLDFYRDTTPDMDREQLMEAAVALPKINNYETTHTVVMRPGVSMKVAFDNAFSGSSPLLDVPIQSLFANPPKVLAGVA